MMHRYAAHQTWRHICASGQDTLSVLFLGNSYTSANNLPQLVKNLTNSAGKTLLVDANIPGGFTISGHLNDATSLNKIRQGNWDYIVIKLCCGIDVSHTTLDISYQNNLGELFHLKVGNNNAGYAKIIEHTGTQYHFVMEATGVYYIRLAFYLHEHGCTLSVVNALSIKRYIQMHLERNKSDKKDAAWICRYAIEQEPP